ncbi:glucose-6-phosphate dehydrogenase [Piptocephalis cylindrospora]|uniref:Glucose-6-phosphate 1-dehydrogenase n=1 Tax=Piptocephalis cylindrospora TaxID=1907219 RepID=A0A4P9Y8X2_9FUNG|nr:glucose-6-phosphate dehydrogenase [Piptocephalis cylindrospora]|eukprot:RKP14440.1 glucose-6-phosphate dehydrogenase [Piptocephalis cylindrospora]
MATPTNTMGIPVHLSPTPPAHPRSTNTIVVFGASGDLAKKKTFPALFGLFKNNFLPKNTHILGYARTEMDKEKFEDRITQYIKLSGDEDKSKLREFLTRCKYINGPYDKDDGYKKLLENIEWMESDGGNHKNRIFYIALPPSVFVPVAQGIKRICWEGEGERRIIVEKPFGKDLESSRDLQRELSALFVEDEIYRIDHYLGKEMVKNIVVLRFSNVFFGAVWNRDYVSNVQITFKEKFGTEGRGGYFDEFGIIRDVMQNHLTQLLSLVAMERPVSLSTEDVRDEKVKVLKSVVPISEDDVLLGQYTASADGKNPGYLDDDTVPKGSKTPTFAAMALQVKNERWEGVPFILKCGKALNDAKAEVRIQFKDVPGNIMPHKIARNELIIRVQPNEAVYVKLTNKMPGLTVDTTTTELDLSYDRRWADVKIPDAYENLILDCIKGDHSNFVRDDELDAAWKIFTPILHQIDEGKIKPNSYEYGSRGPKGLDEFVQRYHWNRKGDDSKL